jgi:hypothetical protein
MWFLLIAFMCIRRSFVFEELNEKPAKEMPIQSGHEIVGYH